MYFFFVLLSFFYGRLRTCLYRLGGGANFYPNDGGGAEVGLDNTGAVAGAVVAVAAGGRRIDSAA